MTNVYEAYFQSEKLTEGRSEIIFETLILTSLGGKSNPVTSSKMMMQDDPVKYSMALVFFSIEIFLTIDNLACRLFSHCPVSLKADNTVVTHKDQKLINRNYHFVTLLT